MSGLQLFIILSAIWSADATAAENQIGSVLWGLVSTGLVIYWVFTN